MHPLTLTSPSPAPRCVAFYVWLFCCFFLLCPLQSFDPSRCLLKSRQRTPRSRLRSRPASSPPRRSQVCAGGGGRPLLVRVIHSSRSSAQVLQCVLSCFFCLDAAPLRKLASHPSTSVMLREALKALDSRKGVSSQAIQNYIKQQYPSVDVLRLKHLVRRALKKGLESGTLVRPANSNITTGATGKFRVRFKGCRLIRRPGGRRGAGMALIGSLFCF